MKSRIDLSHWLYNVAIAHRGLFDNEHPENTISAYEKAIENGYAIELDVQMTIDGVLVCYHDNNLKRLTGVDKDIRTLTYEEVSKLNVVNENFKIPTFSKTLEFVNGKVPLVIELKSQKQKGFEKKVCEILRNYKGDFVVQSFDPLVMRRVQKIEPSFIRGMLTTLEEVKGYPKIVTKFMNNFGFQYIFKFDFLNIRVCDLEYHKKRIKKHNVICWTIKTNNDIIPAKKYAKNIIFEKTATNLDVFDKKYKK